MSLQCFCYSETHKLQTLRNKTLKQFECKWFLLSAAIKVIRHSKELPKLNQNSHFFRTGTRPVSYAECRVFMMIVKIQQGKRVWHRETSVVYTLAVTTSSCIWVAVTMYTLLDTSRSGLQGYSSLCRRRTGWRRLNSIPSSSTQRMQLVTVFWPSM